ncbi:hypothetical protein M0M57_10750 [Flavobacterium azooxidireducens]|uniref:Uncharacterized protein n=1 Tax=Flavobacterium azooxidireducens TaxID=1871076 RepID=A0ABY4KCP6_9FLAO|nr:hypothetical protein [Flavobacterium azooxidireducens]UPQ78101.1 hypothetical protein M0M57_10750 [Flavobacterium azooxidireducens]
MAKTHPIYFFSALRESVRMFGADGLGLWWNEKLLTFEEQIILNKTRYYTKGFGSGEFAGWQMNPALQRVRVKYSYEKLRIL